MGALLLRFLIAGLLLLGVRGLYERGTAQLPLLTVHVKASAGPAEIHSAVADELMLQAAMGQDFLLADPMLSQRLRSLFAEGAPDPAELHAMARGLGLFSRDPILRARLIWHGRRLLAGLSDAPVPQAELERYYAQHGSRYRRPGRLDFHQVFLSRQRHGDAVAKLAEQLHADLEKADAALDWRALGDPPPHGGVQRGMDMATLDRRFGPGFGAQVWAAPDEGWSQPLPSSYGLHLVRVSARVAPLLPPLPEERTRVAADYVHDQQSALLSRGLARARRGYRLQIRRLP